MSVSLCIIMTAFVLTANQSSITDWVELLTAPTVEDEAYDGLVPQYICARRFKILIRLRIPELVDSINLQASGYLSSYLVYPVAPTPSYL